MSSDPEGGRHKYLCSLLDVRDNLTIRLWLGPSLFNCWFSFTLVHRRISHEYSSLFIKVINLVFMFLFDALTESGAFMRTEFYVSSVLRYIGTYGEVGRL